VIANRLSKVLAAAGIASRRTCEKLIESGEVTVNGQVVLIPQTIVQLGKDRIKVAGKLIKAAERKVYYLLNKPAGFVCSNLGTGAGKIVLDLFPDSSCRLFTVGRLDKDTTGLLIVTNDGHFAQRVIHPSSNIQKQYVAKTNGEITPEHLKIIADGIRIDGVLVKPLKVQKVRKGTVKVTIMEGKKHEVRLLLEAAGLKTYALSRVRIGNLLLGALPIGSWREMTEDEMEKIFT
jgi:23S rRNA pseudouridine2605 synthase